MQNLHVAMSIERLKRSFMIDVRSSSTFAYISFKNSDVFEGFLGDSFRKLSVM